MVEDEQLQQHMFDEMKRLQNRVQKMAIKILELEAENEKLEEKVKALETNLEFLQN